MLGSIESETRSNNESIGQRPFLPAGADDVEAQRPEDDDEVRPRQGEHGPERCQLH